MLATNPPGNGCLVHAESVGRLCLAAEVLDQSCEERFHSTPPYGNSPNDRYGNTPLQAYGRTPNNHGMEYKDRLKRARKARKMSQASLAEAVGLDQTTISNLERGKVLSTSKTAQIARALGVDPHWLATGQGEMLSNVETAAAEANTSPSEADYALIPQLSANGHCGDGYLNDHVEVTGGLAFKREWLKRMGARPENLRVIYAEGDSMEPFIVDGDVVLLDLSKTEPTSQRVYAIRRPDGGISIKRLVQRFTGEWVISSDNPNKAKFQDEPLSLESASQVPFVGEVIWRGGAMR